MMLKMIFTAVLLSLYAVNGLQAQTPADSLMALEKVDKPPVFPGCESSEDPKKLLQCFDVQVGSLLGKNINYPSDAREIEAEGTVYLEVIIDSVGRVVDVQNTRPKTDLHPSLVKEAVRVAWKLPRMKPAVHQGRNVPVKYPLPISFKLE